MKFGYYDTCEKGIWLVDPMCATPYVERSADVVLAKMLQDHSAVMVTGPRATGKTTTARRLAKSAVELGDEPIASAVRTDAAVALRTLERPTLVDEWQIVPATLPAIKSIVDGHDARGQFIVTGSVRADVDAPTWPGTGRLVRLPMFGLTEREIEHRAGSDSWLAGLLHGDIESVDSDIDVRGYVDRALRSGFPEPALRLDTDARHRWLTSYVDQLVTRDALEVSAGRDPARLRRYLQAVALNSAGIATDVTLFTAAGVAKKTGIAYERLLENLLVLDNIPAWTSNRLKRLVRAPKRFLVDAGLFAGVLGTDTAEVLRDGDLLGRVIETFAVSQIRAELALKARRPRLYHLRTGEGRHEIDLVIELGARSLVAIEVKATAAPRPRDARHLKWFKETMGDSVIACVLLHTGPRTFMIDEHTVAAPIAALWR